MSSKLLLLLALASTLGLAACGGGAEAADGDSRRLTITGSSTVAPLAAEMARRFEASHPGVRIDVQTGGSSKGIGDVSRGLADIGMASRALKGSELGEVEAHTVAIDGVGLIVHSSNPVHELSDDDVRSIFRGETPGWSAFGGSDGEITVINKASGRATLDVFLEHFGLDEAEIVPDVVIGDNQQGIKTVAGNPLAIGYVSIGAAESEIAAGAQLRLLPAGGVPATKVNLGAGLFPISRPLNLVTRGKPEGLVKEFIDYCRSDAVHDLIDEIGFAPHSR